MSEATISRTTRQRRKGYTMRDARTGQYLTVTGEARKAVPQAKEIGRVLGFSTNAVTVLFEALRAATSKSRAEGTPLQFTVEVEPDGAPRIVAPDVAVPANRAVEVSAETEAALGRARARGRDRAAAIMAQPDMLSAEDFAQQLNTTRETINSRRKQHRVLGLQGATRGFRYPAWQVDADGRPFEALPDIFDRLGDSPWAVYRFLVQEHGELDGLSGREALRRGLSDQTIEAAESVARAFA